MRVLTKKLWLPGTLLIGLLFSGCLLVSATFVIVEDFSFTAASGFYYDPLDITTNSDWEKHKDNIDLIDAVGFEMTMVNDNAVPVTFNAYIAPASAPVYTRKGQLDSLAYVIIQDLTAEPDTTKVTYAQSLTHLKNLDKLKELVMTGAFALYGTSTGGVEGAFKVDPGKVIITFSASN